METVIIISVIAVGLIVTGFLLWLISVSFAGRRDLAAQAKSIEMLQQQFAQQLEAIRQTQNNTSETLSKSLQQGHSTISQNLNASNKLLTDLRDSIGQLHGTNKQMLRLGEQVTRLQEILSSPKLRGQMGEWSLENLLSNVLPEEGYKTQYCFQDGKIVDAIVKAGDFIVPVDAKFPLPSFEKLINAPDEQQRKKLRRQFCKDVTIHIDKIAQSYIRPAEGTLDFAMMYIPAENVYYETVVKNPDDNNSLLNYALDKKVIPVSPNLLYVYLMTIAMGLHGLQIEKQAAQIRENLKKLNSLFVGFTDNFDTLGKHLRNAGNKYTETRESLDRLTLHLEAVQDGDDNG